jgi:hypothetical protein
MPILIDRAHLAVDYNADDPASLRAHFVKGCRSHWFSSCDVHDARSAARFHERFPVRQGLRGVEGRLERPAAVGPD